MFIFHTQDWISYTTAEPGNYQLQWSRDLKTWHNLGAAVEASPTPMEVDATDSAGLGQRYYRVLYSRE